MGSKKETVVQKSEAPEEIKPLLTEITDLSIGGLRDVRSTLDDRDGQLFARRNETQLRADALAKDAAREQQNLAGGTRVVADKLAQDLAGGQLFDPTLSSTAARDEAVNAAINPVQRRFEEQLLPQLVTAAVTSGNADNSRLGLEVSRLARDQFAQPALDLAGQISFADLQNRRSNEISQVQTGLQASALLPQLSSQQLALSVAPSNILSQVGAREQQEQQNILNEPLQSPFIGLNETLGTITGANPFGSTQTQKSVPSFTDQLIGGISTGLSFGLPFLI